MIHIRSKLFSHRKLLFSVMTLSSVLLITQPAMAGPIHAYFADELNPTPNDPTGNKILEIDIENMTLVNSLAVPGLLGHHADNGFNSKIYGVPKASGYVNVIELRKDSSGTLTTMENARKVNLTHKPRSGDAFNKKFNVILMTAANRPMGSFIDVVTDKVVGTIGEEIDCKLTDGTQLLSKSDANTIAAATKYQCAHEDHGGDQISGHPYWLTPDYAVIVDRSNRRLSTYFVWKEGTQLKSRLVNHLDTRTAIHQIIPRDRTRLPSTQQADFFAVEEGKAADEDLQGGIAHSLLKLKLTTRGLVLEKRMDLQRTEALPKDKAARILSACIKNYRATIGTSLNEPSAEREATYNSIFQTEGITRSTAQDPNNDFPLDCFYPGIPGGHNADFAPNNKHVYVGMAGGATSVIDVNRWKIVNNLDIGVGSGPGHTCFSTKHDIGFSVTHAGGFVRTIKKINSDRPKSLWFLRLPYAKEGLIKTLQSHTCYIDESEDYYYNFWTDGGVFFKIDIAAAAANTVNGSSDPIVDSLYVGGIPIQGSYINLDDIKTAGADNLLKAKNDAASSDGSSILVNVLANDSGVGLKLTELDAATNGKIVIENNQVRYTPNAGFSGGDGFWYKTTDSRGFYTWGFAAIDVTVLNPPSTELKAFGESVRTNGSAITIDVLANDVGNGLTIVEVDAPVYGTAKIVDNKISYQPKAGVTGVDEFWYKVQDSIGYYTWAKVLVTLPVGIPNVLIGVPDISMTSGQVITIDAIANDRGTGLTIVDTGSPTLGTATVVQNKIRYTPTAGSTGLDNFYYKITDFRGFYTWGKVIVTIN